MKAITYIAAREALAETMDGVPPRPRAGRYDAQARPGGGHGIVGGL